MEITRDISDECSFTIRVSKKTEQWYGWGELKYKGERIGYLIPYLFKTYKENFKIDIEKEDSTHFKIKKIIKYEV